MAAAAGGATQHPRGVNENKVNAFSPYYLTLEEKEAGRRGGRRVCQEAERQEIKTASDTAEICRPRSPQATNAATLFARRGGAPRRHALTGSSQGAEASQPD